MNRETLEREMLARPVQSLQYMLGRLAKKYGFLPELTVDGIWGEKTREAVALFQQKLHPPVTGVVNRGTWNAIWNRWLELERMEAAPRAVRIFPGEGCRVKPGIGREFMVIPQSMIQVLSNHLEGIAPDTADGQHGAASADNVRWLQRLAGLKETGTMDQMAWEILSRLYEIFVVRDPEGASQESMGVHGQPAAQNHGR